MGLKNILEGFKEMGKTFKTGKGYEERVVERRRNYEKAQARAKRKRATKRKK